MNRNTTDVMVDIETLGTSPDAAIIGIGAVAFDPYRMDDAQNLSDHFSTAISFESNEQHHRIFEAGAVRWWLSQSKEAQNKLLNQSVTNLPLAIKKFLQFVSNLQPKPRYLWANSPSFDFVILKQAAKAVGEPWPFAYWQEQDVRTLKNLSWPNGDAPSFKELVAHDAVDDAIKQIFLVQLGYNRLILR